MLVVDNYLVPVGKVEGYIRGMQIIIRKPFLYDVLLISCANDKFIEAVKCPDCGDYYAEGSLVLVELEDGTETEVCPYCYEDNYFIPPEVNKEEV